MEIRILAQKKGQPPVLRNLRPPFADLRSLPELTFVVVEGGMSSGEPAVEIVSTSQNGTVLLATSLDKLIMACSGMIGMAEKLWGWKQPEGYATIMPGLNREKRKEILESIKKELEEWDEVEDG